MPVSSRIFPPDEAPPQGNQMNILSRLWGGRADGRGSGISDPSEESRREVERLNGQVIEMAGEIDSQKERIAQIQKDLENLEERFGEFCRRRGRRAGYAFLSLGCFFFSWAIDLVFMAPVAEVIASWSGLSPEMPVRIIGSLAVTSILYGIGAKFGIARQDRQPAWFWLLLGVVIVPSFFGRMAFNMAEEAGQPKAMALLGILGSYFAFGAGAIIPDALDYLSFLINHHRLRQKVRNLQDRYLRAGPRFMELWTRLRQAIDRHERNFHERIEPYVTEVVQKTLEAFSRGQYNLEIRQPPSNESSPGQGENSPSSPGPTLAVDNDGQPEGESPEEAFLRNQLQNTIWGLNEELRVPYPQGRTI
jgi:hypothetical protein